jgi:hypothetical protein
MLSVTLHYFFTERMRVFRTTEAIITLDEFFLGNGGTGKELNV